MRNDITNKADIRLLVDTFYDQIRNDDLLSPIFSSRIAAEKWPAHLERMYAFWGAILFAEKGFEGNPMQKHLALPIDGVHFDRWLQLFNNTVDNLFSGSTADEAKKRAAGIAQILQFKISTLKA